MLGLCYDFFKEFYKTFYKTLKKKFHPSSTHTAYIISIYILEAHFLKS